MGKDKIRRFAELYTFSHVLQPTFDEAFGKDYRLKGKWNQEFFSQSQPITLELGCGKGEYAVALAATNPQKNYIGLDIKGARMWVGARKAMDLNLENVGFLRTNINFISSYFAKDEVNEIWITFPDPQEQSNRRRKRLTSSIFLNRYKQMLAPDGIIHLKTDNTVFFNYTLAIIEDNKLPLLCQTRDLYNSPLQDLTHGIKTHYEELFLKQGKPINYLQFQFKDVKTYVEPGNDKE